MNQRIKELADQVLPNEKEFHKGDPKNWGYFFSGEELEKFAELIVKECAALLKKEAQSNYDEGTETYNLLLKESKWIKKYFGVEE